MRLTALLTLSFLPFILAAPSTLDPRATCPKTPCAAFVDVLDYCSATYTPNVLSGADFKGTKAISCVCSKEAVEAITKPKVTTLTGLETAVVCYECGKSAGDGLVLLELWIVTCETAKHKGLAAAKKCWNTKAEKGCWKPSNE